MTAPKRALIVTRLSVLSDVTSSPEFQLEKCRQLISQREYEEVGIAEDLDVSGAVDPFDRKRPQLSDWLNNRFDEFDVIVVYRVDRLSRSVRGLQKVVNWAEERGKLVVSATEQHFDMSTKWAAVIIALLGTIAEMELEAISERNRNSYRFRRAKGNYTGGLPPWGYRQSDKDRTRLEVDPRQRALIEEATQRLFGGDTLTEICRSWTERGIPTLRDQQDIDRGREPKGRDWYPGVLREQLMSPSLLGQTVTGDGVAREADGSPVQAAPAVLERADYDRLRQLLGESKKTRDTSTRSQSLLLRVLFCSECGLPGYRQSGTAKAGGGRSPDRYRCRSQVKGKGQWCGNTGVSMEEVDRGVEALILGLLGQSERMTREWEAGSDASGELADLDAELADLVSVLGTGPYRAGSALRAQLDQRIEQLSERAEELRALETIPAGWTWRGTGQLFSEWWNDQTVQAKNRWLTSMGVRVTWARDGKAGTPEYRVDLGDLETLTEQMTPKGATAGYSELFTAMTENGVAGIEIRDGVPRVIMSGEEA